MPDFDKVAIREIDKRAIPRNRRNNMLVCFNYANAIEPKSASRRRVYRRTDRLRHGSGPDSYRTRRVNSSSPVLLNIIRKQDSVKFIDLSFILLYYLTLICPPRTIHCVLLFVPLTMHIEDTYD